MTRGLEWNDVLIGGVKGRDDGRERDLLKGDRQEMDVEQ